VGWGRFRFLNASLFFVSSLFGKKSSRIQGLVIVMTLVLLVYSVTPHRLQKQYADQGATILDHIDYPTQWPTLREVFHLWERIHRVQMTVEGRSYNLGEGRNSGANIYAILLDSTTQSWTSGSVWCVTSSQATMVWLQLRKSITLLAQRLSSPIA
jgi:hypothetical protein